VSARSAMSVKILSTAAQVYKSLFERLAVGNDLEYDSRSSELPLFDRPCITSY